MSHRFDEHGDGGGGGGGGGSDSAKLYRQHLLRHHSHQQQQQQQRASAFFFAELNTDLATYADPAAISDSDRRLCCPGCCGIGGGYGGAGRVTAAAAAASSFSVLSKRHAFRWDRKLLLRLLPLHSIFALTMAAAEAAAVAAAPSAASAVEPAVRCCLYTTTLALLCGAACFVGSRRFQPGSHAGAAAALDLACAALMSVAALPLSAARPAALPSGLWQVAPLLLSVLCLLPLPILLTAGYCVMLATGYTVCSGLLAYRRCGGGSGGETAMPEACRHLRAHFWNSLAGCIIVQVAVLSVGALLQRSREADLAASLRHARRYIASRVSLERQTDKLDRLVTSLVPQSLAAELKLNCLRGFIGFDGCRVAQASGVAVVSACIDGLTNFPAASFASADAARLLHQLLCHMDHLTLDYQGYRGSFDGDTYLVTFGFPLATDACRAQQALQFSLALHEFVSGLAERSHLPLTLRVGIACGPVSGCVLGQQRIVYGLVGEAADTADALQRLCQPGRILVSRDTYLEIAAAGLSAETGPILPPESGVGGVATVSVWTDRLQAQLRRFIQRQQQQQLHHQGPASPAASSMAVSPETRRRGDRLLRLLRATAAPSAPNASSVASAAPSTPNLLLLLLREAPFDYLAENGGGGGDGAETNGAGGKYQANGHASMSLGDSADSSTAATAAAAAAALTDSPSEEAVSGWLLERCGRGLAPLISKVPKMHWLTMNFESDQLEREFHQQEDRGFLIAMATTALVLLLSGCLHATVLPRTTLLLMLFMISFTWTGMLLMVLLAARLKCLEFNIQKSYPVRLVVVFVSILLTYCMSQTNVLCCRLSLLNATVSGPFFRQQPGEDAAAYYEDLSCPSPLFICLAGLLCLMLPPAFPGLPALAQQLLALCIAVGFAATAAGSHRQLFELWDSAVAAAGPAAASNATHWPGTAAASAVSRWLSQSLVGGLLALALTAAVAACLARLRTAARREAFAWAYQTTDSQLEVLLVKEACSSLVKNLLPEEVASAILRQPIAQRNFLHSLCVEEHSLIAVLHIGLSVASDEAVSASPNSAALTGHSGRCLANLTALIDELLDHQQQQQHQHQPTSSTGDIVKIRCTGRASVRLAVGLNRRLRDTPASKLFHLAQLLQFACRLRRRLPSDCGNGCRLRLRMGAHLGSGFTALVGSVRPVFDLWGEAARVADALAGAGGPGQLLVSEPVHSLARQQFDFAPHPAVWLDGARWPAMALRDQPAPAHQRPQLHPQLRQLHQQNRLSAPCCPQPSMQLQQHHQLQQHQLLNQRRPPGNRGRRRDSRVHSVVRPVAGLPTSPLLPLQPLPPPPPPPPPLPRSTSIDHRAGSEAGADRFDFPAYRRPSSPPPSTVVDRIVASSLEPPQLPVAPPPPLPSSPPLPQAPPQDDGGDDSIVVSLMSLTVADDDEVDNDDEEVEEVEEAAERLRMMRPVDETSMAAMQQSGSLGLAAVEATASAEAAAVLQQFELQAPVPAVAMPQHSVGSGPASESNYDNLSSDGGGVGGCTAEQRIASEARRLRRLVLPRDDEATVATADSRQDSPTDFPPGDSSRMSSPTADSRLGYTTDSRADSRLDSRLDSPVDSRFCDSRPELRPDSRMDSSLSEGEVPVELIHPSSTSTSSWRRRDRDRRRRLPRPLDGRENRPC
ncbi:hypothetical protein BOX15_Mlig009489g1 [Macrostomum lignano]|uniref:adenylate cyclase n=1 Tax=Macrostomum lignano TaxID=282301 RepID=A0A267E4U7_9PLAT|nr:hypothetical protein BOX15_Mlig009489g1 [Macrostomum lignano]